jgi:energy-coupling factor transporter ATP-binding protein EcfA2
MSYAKSMTKENDRMNISYIWVGNVKNTLFQNESFNFNSRFSIKFEVTSNTIHISKRDEYIEDFFSENIINITALVGKNGAGKTTVLKLLPKALSPLNEKMLTIINTGDTFHVLYGLLDQEPNIHSDKDYQIEYYHFSKGEYDNSVKRLENNIGLFNIIYFSNSLNNSFESSHRSPNFLFSNISTGYLAFNKINDKSVFREKRSLENLFGYDMLLMINFLIYEKSKLDNMVKPNIKYIQFIPRNNYDRELAEAKKYTIVELFDDSSFHEGLDSLILDRILDFRNNLFSQLNKLKLNIKNSSFNKSEKHSIYFKLTTVIDMSFDFFSSFYNSRIKTKNIKKDIYNQLILLDYHIILDINITNFLDKIVELLIQLEKQVELNLRPAYRIIAEDEQLLNNELQKLVYFRILICNLKVFDGKWEEFDNHQRLLLNLNEVNLNSLRIFYDSYLKITTKGYLDFKWVNEKEGEMRPFSSGEEALFKTYSRLYSIIDSVENDNFFHISRENNNLTILLDEPELYFHPDWQSQLIDLLITYFKTIFNNYNIQLILTSNTPFLLSDLPRENVLLLKKKFDYEIQDYVTKVDYDSVPRTFSQNIYTLLKDAFFMKSTVGGFASNKISEIMDLLNWDDDEKSPNNSKLQKRKFVQKKDYIKKVIELVGEPLIRNHLMGLYKKRLLQCNELTIEQKIIDINEEINKLIQIKNQLQSKDLSSGDKKND